MTETRLTSRQTAMLDFIREHIAEWGYAPTVREIGRAVGLASPSTVHAHLAQLEALGFIDRRTGSPRTLRVLPGREVAEQLEMGGAA